MEEKFEKYLPVGTVVMLKGGKKRVMITGFCSIAQEQEGKIFDYSGCLYPEGYLSANQVCLFDHEQIDKVYHLGLVDEEEKAFKVKLEGFMKNAGSNITSQSSPVEQPKVPTVEEEKTVEKEEFDINSINLNSNLNDINLTDLNLEDDNESNNDDDFFVI